MATHWGILAIRRELAAAARNATFEEFAYGHE
jgi:hypothetical protein